MKAHIRCTRNPIKPMIKIPIPVIFITVLNSSELGFLVTLKTLIDWLIKLFNF
jgi:hypothetical protein